MTTYTTPGSNAAKANQPKMSSTVDCEFMVNHNTAKMRTGIMTLPIVMFRLSLLLCADNRKKIRTVTANITNKKMPDQRKTSASLK